MRPFEELRIWQDAQEIALAVYALLKDNKDYGFRDQIQRAAISISNNIAERSIRPFTIGRKNWVFSGSPAGAEASAAAYSLIETCIANKVDTKEYLEYIFTNMSQEESLEDDAVLEKYLPWNVALPTE